MRLRAHDERMSAEAFDALSRLCALSRKARGYQAARLVLVEGMGRAEAAQKAGASRQSLQITLWRYRKLRELVKQAAG